MDIAIVRAYTIKLWLEGQKKFEVGKQRRLSPKVLRTTTEETIVQLTASGGIATTRIRGTGPCIHPIIGDRKRTESCTALSRVGPECAQLVINGIEKLYQKTRLALIPLSAWMPYLL